MFWHTFVCTQRSRGHLIYHTTTILKQHLSHYFLLYPENISFVIYPFAACFCICFLKFTFIFIFLNSGPELLDQWRSFLNLFVFCLFAHVFPGCSVFISQAYCTKHLQNKFVLIGTIIVVRSKSAWQNSLLFCPKAKRNKMHLIYFHFNFFVLFNFLLS